MSTDEPTPLSPDDHKDRPMAAPTTTSPSCNGDKGDLLRPPVPLFAADGAILATTNDTEMRGEFDDEDSVSLGEPLEAEEDERRESADSVTGVDTREGASDAMVVDASSSSARGGDDPQVKESRGNAGLHGDNTRAKLMRENARLRAETETLNVANKVAEQMHEILTAELTVLKKEKSGLEQQVGKLMERVNELATKLNESRRDLTVCRRKFDAEYELVEDLQQRRAGTNPAPRIRPSVPTDDVEMGEIKQSPSQRPKSQAASSGAREREVSNPAARTMERPGRPRITMSVPPPARPANNIDARGFPLDVDTWRYMRSMILTGHFFVYAHRLLYMWTYLRAIPEAERTAVQSVAVAEYLMPDWQCDSLAQVDPKKVAEKATELKALMRDKMDYNPELLAQLIQFQEWSQITGCPFSDDSWTVNMRLVRRLSLFDSVTMGNRSDRSDARRMARAPLEKAILEVFCTPQLYKNTLTKMQLTPATTFAPGHWPEDQLQPMSVEVVTRRFALMGISTALIDDAFAFGQRWAHDWLNKPVVPVGWVANELMALTMASDGVNPPPGFFHSSKDFYPRSPELPWGSAADHIIHCHVSDWQHPEMKGLRRPEGSHIQMIINRGLHRPPPPNQRRVESANPFRAAVQRTLHSGTRGGQRARTKRNPPPSAGPPGPTALTPATPLAVHQPPPIAISSTPAAESSPSNKPSSAADNSRAIPSGLPPSVPPPSKPLFQSASTSLSAPSPYSVLPAAFPAQVQFIEPHPQSWAASDGDLQSCEEALRAAGFGDVLDQPPTTVDTMDLEV
ncbi:hypothetical protein FB451DRAFT_1434850 [Mycena latifolia]|nr:hypothetical protein FB451DRAFT_1434850 [Mycena latifolia]